MIQILKLSVTFMLLTTNLFGQYSEIVIKSTYLPDKSLKEVLEFRVDGKDSSLAAKEYYSEGLIQLRQSFWKDTVRNETSYQYNEYNQPNIITKILKDNKNKDASKSITIYLYDQYGNLYLERHMDSVPDNIYNFRLRNQEFTSYIYQDSLVIYSNKIRDFINSYQEDFKRYEYDDKRRLKKVFNDDQRDTSLSYILDSEHFYDEKGSHIKTIRYCQTYVTDMDGNRLDHPCKNDTIHYTYNSQKQLTTEHHLYHNGPFTNVDFQKNTLEYNYDNRGRLVSVLNTMEQAIKYITIRHYIYL